MGQAKRIKSKRIQIWMLPTLYKRVIEKADRESVNLSALVRNYLRDWLNGEAEDESPAPQKGP